MIKKYIRLASRLAGFIIDYIPFYLLLSWLGRYGAAGYAVCLILLFGYRYLCTAAFGATLGMELLKLRLDRHDYKICLKREIIRFSSAFFYIGYLYAIFDSKGRTFHDIAAGTMVLYQGSREEVIKIPFLIRPVIYLILIVAVLKWTSSFILNDIGNIGLKKVYSSEKYFQSFDGDNLLSLSQKQLYNSTLGRKYTAVVDIGKKPYIIKISNKVKYTEVYKLNISGAKLVGQFIYKIDTTLQYIDSGIFRDRRELCGLSPGKEIVLVDEEGNIFGKGKVGLQNVLSLKCGDLDGDRRSEIAVLDRSGNLEILDYDRGNIITVFNGKVGEDIVPEAFYLNKGIMIMAKGEGKSIIYTYKFAKGKFTFVSRKYIAVDDISSMGLANNYLIISNINRSNMMFNVGKIQTLEAYKIGNKITRLYNFGKRPAARYAYRVENLEEACDIDGDGSEELILKSVSKGDVMGNGYRVEVWKFRKGWVWANYVMTKITSTIF